MKRRGLLWLPVVLSALACVPLAAQQDAPRPRIGLNLEQLSPEQLDALAKSVGQRVGVRVAAVMPGSPAEKAGLKAGDLILAIAKHGVASPPEVIQAFADKVGRTEVTIARPDADGSFTSATVFVDAPAAGAQGPAPGPAPEPVPATNGGAGSAAQAAGLGLEALSADDLDTIRRFANRGAGGVVSRIAPGSPAARAGFQRDDVIFSVAGRNVDSLAAIEQALAAGGKLKIQVGRAADAGGFKTADLTLDLPGGAGLVGGGPTPQPVVNRPGPAPADLQAKLQALEAARNAGILSEEEYARKKAELQAQLQTTAPPLDEATKQKLQALDVARQAGILSDEEYARKRAELLGGRAAGPAPGPVATAPQLVQYTDPEGRFRLRHPLDWVAEPVPNGPPLRLTHGGVSIDLITATGVQSSQSLLSNIHNQIREQCQDYRELRKGAATVGGRPASLIEFTATNPQGARRLTQLIAFVGEGRMGYVFIVDAAEDEFAAARPAWEAILNSFTLAPGGGGG